MDNNEFFEILSNSIISIELPNGEIKAGLFEIKDYNAKYSSLKIASKRLFLDDELIPTKDTKIVYKCTNCEIPIKILLKKFLNKNSTICRSCKEHDVSKKEKQSMFMKKTFSEFGKIKSFKSFKEFKTIDEKIEDSISSFQIESDEFKNEYESNHLTEHEFQQIKDKIYKIGDFEISDKMKYIYVMKTNNQMKYSSYLYDKNANNLINFNNVVYICDSCGELFSSSRKPKEKFVNNHKYLCPKCYLSNRTFKIKPIKNILNKDIMYQSNPELKLINFFNQNNIVIENGPTVYFVFNGKKRKYRIDYSIPKYSLLIEIKGNHIWHQEQVISGKWELKENTAIEYAEEHKLKYLLIFDDKLDEFIKSFKI